MSGASTSSLRVALLHHALEDSSRSPADASARELAFGLAALGHDVAILACHRGGRAASSEGGVRLLQMRRLPEGPLRARGFATPLTQVPFMVAALRAGRYDVAHAFSPIDAKAGSIWARIGGGPVLLTLCEPLARERLADKRGRLRVTTDAFADSAAVTAADDRVASSIERWLARQIPVLDPRDASAYEAVYRRIVG